MLEKYSMRPNKFFLIQMNRLFFPFYPMAHEQIVRLSRARDHFPFSIGIGEPDGVHITQAGIERRMVLKQQQRTVRRRRGQRLAPPPAAQRCCLRGGERASETAKAGVGHLLEEVASRGNCRAWVQTPAEHCTGEGRGRRLGRYEGWGRGRDSGSRG